jgi:hypothetical protein
MHILGSKEYLRYKYKLKILLNFELKVKMQ